jgi:phage portal protein BeeE/2'-5' RNA ligase
MGLLKQAITGSKSAYPVVRGTGYELGRSFTPTSTLAYYYRNDYENAYPSIRVISQRFAAIEPYTIDKTGNGVSSNVLDRLYTPNKQMSAYDFREALAVMSLVHNKVYLRVHHRGTRITADSLTGFTFLEGVSEHLVDGRLEFWLPSGEKLTTAEVAVLKSINPYDLNDGFSPAFAARRWTSLDDLIADYQTGFFTNGGVPAGQFIITAKTATDYKDIVAGIKDHHQGAGRGNGVLFAHRPTDLTGKPLDSQIEWVPFSTTNKDMALKDLFEQANKKIDSTYGVPASLRGVNDNNTYASVRVDEQIFVENTLDPFTLKVWQKFTHQLNLVTGGMGLAITYDLETPVVADEEKVKAEAKQTDAQTVINLTQAGYTVESAIEYVATGDISVLAKKPEEKKRPEVLDSDEARDTPDQPVDPTRRQVKSLTKQVSARDFPDLYEGTGINPDDLGCIMIDTEPLEVTSLVEDGEADLVEATPMDRSPVPGQDAPHITLLYGLLENGNVWKDKVDAVLEDWSMEKATIDKVDYFDTPDAYAVVAHIKPTPELIEGHERLTLLPHIQTFSEYKPHMTLAYIDKAADVGKWIKALGAAYNGRKIKVTGINYGDEPDEDESSKAATPSPKAKALSPEDRADYEAQLAAVIRERMTAQVEAAEALASSKAVTPEEPVDPEEDARLSEGMLAVLAALIAYQGPIEHVGNIELVFQAGISVDNVGPFRMTGAQQAEYTAYLQKVGRSYNGQTAERIRNILMTGRQENLTAGEMRRQLRGLLNEEWRITRLVTSEINHAGNSASLWSMQEIATETGAKVQKLWDHSGGDDPCPLCLYMLALEPVDVFDTYVQLGETLELPDGTSYTNDFMPVDGSRDVHPHGHCRQIYRVAR